MPKGKGASMMSITNIQNNLFIAEVGYLLLTMSFEEAARGEQ